MTELELKDLTEKFTDYVHRFQSDNSDIQLHMDMKAVHTEKVVEHCQSLAKVLGLTVYDNFLCQAIGLLHDLGRFKQYTLYHTFNDAISTNHAQLALTELQELGWLKRFSADEQEMIQFAIAYHNAVGIPSTATTRQAMFAKIIRDADKLDIYRVLQPMLTPPTPDGCTPSLLDKLLTGGQSLYTAMKTPDDRKLVRLMWIYDINYSWTIQQILAKNYVNVIFNYLPDEAEFHEAKKKLHDYMQRKSEQQIVVQQE
jgi:hypothetical protein